MKSFYTKRDDEQGYILITTLLIMLLLTLIGISATKMGNTEIKIAAYDSSIKSSFYAAEAARGYVVRNTPLYLTENVTIGEHLNFPNNDAPDERLTLNQLLTFNGEVEYLGSMNPPRGSGFEAGKYKAHRYEMLCTGYAGLDFQSVIDAGFYRIGF